MNFNVKMDDKKLQVDIKDTNLKDILVYCKPKESLVLMKKYGLDWTKWIPLQRIGKQYNLTRERIRQIETQALMRFRRLIVWNDTYMLVLNEAVKVIDSNGWFLTEGSLISKMVNKNIFKFSKQELKLILVSDFNVTYLKRNKFLNRSFYLEPLYEDVLTKMVFFIQDYFGKRNQSQDLYEFIGYMKDIFVKEYKDISYFKNDLFYINFFESVKDISMFDGKIWFPTFADVNPKTIKLKILYTMRRINKPIHYQELPAKIIERFPQKNVKLNTIHNELVKNNDIFVNLGLGIYWLKERGYEWGQVKDILVRIFEKNQRPMNVKELCREMLKEKMVSPNTVMLNLQKYKEMFQRVDKWVYEIIKK